MTSLISQKTENGVLYVTMDNSKKRNALSSVMIATLQHALDKAAENSQVRVIVLGANGPAYCAGHDLNEMSAARTDDDGGKAFYQSVMANCSHLMRSIVTHRCPVIADVRGVASAAGCQIVASCDLAIASTKAQFCTPGVNIGLFCSTPMVALSRNLSRKHAMEMLLTGDMISAERAEQMGLINTVVDEADMNEAINAMALKIASKSTMTMRTGKSAFYQQAEMNLADAYDYATKVMVENMLRNDAREGIGAFVEKRDPTWSDS